MPREVQLDQQTPLLNHLSCLWVKVRVGWAAPEADQRDQRWEESGMQLSGVHGESRAKRASESTHQPQGHPATMALVADTLLGLGESPHVHFVPTMRVVTFLTKLMPKGINLSTVRQLVNRGVEMGNHKPWLPGSRAQREQGHRKHSGAGEPQMKGLHPSSSARGAHSQAGPGPRELA